MADFSKHSMEDIYRLIAEKTGCEYSKVLPESDICSDLGCVGDDFDELISEYAKCFDVKMDNYLWYFHTEEEGHFHSIGRLFFTPPYERVKRIPITPAVLLRNANLGEWETIYPEHHIPSRRYDILINQIVMVVFLLFVICKCIR